MNDTNDPTFRSADWAALGFALVFPTLVTWVFFVLLASHPASLQQTAYSIGKLIQFTFPIVWVLVICREAIRFRRPRRRGLIEGLVFGGLITIAMLVLYFAWLLPAGLLSPDSAAGEAVWQKVSGFGITNLPGYIAMGTFYSVAHSFLEEYYWRWFVFGRLRRAVSLKWAIAISSIGFMAHHVVVLGLYFGWTSPATYFFSVSVAVGGAVWAWIYHRSESLIGPWLSHLLIDAGIFLVGYHLVAEMLVR